MAVPDFQNGLHDTLGPSKFEFRNGSIKGITKRRYLSDPHPSVLEKMLYKKLPTPQNSDNVEFLTFMKALKQMEEFARLQVEEAIGGIYHGDGEEKVHVELQIPIIIPTTFKEIKEETYGNISYICLIFTVWKTKVAEIIETITQRALKEELVQLEYEIDRAIHEIRIFQNHLDNCHTFDELKKRNNEFVETFRSIDEAIDARKKDIQLEMDLGLDSFTSPSFGARLCFLLGLDLNAYQEIEELDGNVRDYHSTEQWILMSMVNGFKYLEDSNKFELSVEVLEKLGFSKYAAKMLVDAIPAKERAHLSTIHWVTAYIKNQFKYHILLARECPDRFPFRNESTRTWFTLEESETQRGTNGCNLTEIFLINLEGRQDDSFKLQDQNSFPENLIDEEYVVLFHGTDHLSAMDILLHGIDLREGKGNCDFSYEKGFYLVNNIEDAINWGFILPKSKPAVLVYQVKRDWLRGRNFLDLRGEHFTEEWRKTCHFYISGAKDKKRRLELDRYEFIEGPLVARQRCPQTGCIQLIPCPGSYQLCITDENFAEEFNFGLHSILFYD